MARRRRNPPDLYHHTTAEKAARIYREQRLRSAGEPDVYVTTADYDIGYGPVAVPIYVPAKMLQLDDEFPDGRKDYRVRTKGGSAPVYAGKPFPVRKPNPAGDVVYIPQEVLDRQPTGHVTYDHRGNPRILVDPGTGEAPTWRRVALLNRVVTATARHRAGDSWYMANYEWHTGPERLYGQPRSAWAPFVYGRTGYRDFAVGEQPVAFIRAALAATRAYDRVNRKTDDPGQSTRAASEAYHRTARVLAGRKLNPAGRLLQFPLREIRVEAFPVPLSDGWLLRLHINGQDAKDAVRDIKTGQARIFDSSAKAAAWWKKHGQAFVDAMGRAACVRTRKANPAWNMTRDERDVLHRVWTEVVVDGRHVDASTLTILKRLHRWGLLRASTGGWKSIPATYRISRRGQREIETEYYGPRRKRKGNPAGSPFAAEVARLRSDPTLQSASMRQHLRNVAKAPGSGRPRRSAAAREWKEFAGYEPNHVEKIDGVALKGNLPGVRVDVMEGVGAETGRRVKIDAGQKPLYLVWFKSGERFAVTGGPSAMRELARDFSRLNEPIYLTKVDYVAPRYPVPEGVRRTKANAELSIAFTHAVENPTLMTWNGKLDPRHARFDIRVKGRRRRWVNRSGLIF